MEGTTNMINKRKIRPGELASDSLNYIVAIIIIFVIVFPFFWILSTSLKPKTEVYQIPPKFIPDHPTLENYIGGNRNNLLMYTKNSILTSVFTVLATISLATLAAYVMSFLKYKLNKFFNLIFVAIQILPVVTAVVPLFMMFKAMGIINTRLSLILTYSASAWGIPIAVILLSGYLGEIPVEIFEAARIDGCSTIGVFWRIVLRLGMPGIVTTSIYVFIAVWQELLLVYRLISRESLKTLPPGLESFVGQYTTDWGGLMATSVVIAVPAMILFLAVQKYFINNLAGAVKG
jgi:ABC-type glycerol-3-phosphate transport system permease component